MGAETTFFLGSPRPVVYKLGLLGSGHIGPTLDSSDPLIFVPELPAEVVETCSNAHCSLMLSLPSPAFPPPQPPMAIPPHKPLLFLTPSQHLLPRGAELTAEGQHQHICSL